MITPDSEEAFKIKDYIKRERSFRIGSRGICIDCVPDNYGWNVNIPRAGIHMLNCDSLHYDSKSNTLIGGADSGYISIFELELHLYDVVRCLE